MFLQCSWLQLSSLRFSSSSSRASCVRVVVSVARTNAKHQWTGWRRERGWLGYFQLPFYPYFAHNFALVFQKRNITLTLRRPGCTSTDATQWLSHAPAPSVDVACEQLAPDVAAAHRVKGELWDYKRLLKYGKASHVLVQEETLPQREWRELWILCGDILRTFLHFLLLLQISELTVLFHVHVRYMSAVKV